MRPEDENGMEIAIAALEKMPLTCGRGHAGECASTCLEDCWASDVRDACVRELRKILGGVARTPGPKSDYCACGRSWSERLREVRAEALENLAETIRALAEKGGRR